ncbi:hypothetical protein LI328DRAFT_162208 [Trichoderma asperelloides]|nr:hypothetical protein LI328DRAFT_162208 [Trichoderma asperelloides]
MEMQKTEDAAQASPMRNPEDLSLTDTQSEGKKSRKLSTRKKKPLLCNREGCNMVFPRPSDLTKHIQQKHDRHIPCKANQDDSIECEKYFGDNKAMERHVWAKHREFAENPANGIRKQEGECPHCLRIISRRDNLNRHIKEKHLDTKRRTKSKS